MIKSLSIFLLKGKVERYFKKSNSGSTLAESLAAMSILTITLSTMFPALMQQKDQNVNQRILTGAIALSKETLDDLRQQPILKISLGQSTKTGENSGYPYQIVQYVCTQPATVNSDGSVTCSTQISSNSSNLRYILLNIKNNGNKIYTVETVFTKLR